MISMDPAIEVNLLSQKAIVFSYSSSLFFNIASSVSIILIPLYALHLGYDPLQIGTLISSAGIFHVLLRIFGGMLSDYFEERPILWTSYTVFLAGTLILGMTESFWSIFFAQLIMGAARSFYWTASQSYSTRINERQASGIIAKLTSVTSAGQVLGFFLGGVIAALLGYQLSFFTCAAISFIALVLSVIMPKLPRKTKKRKPADIFKPIPAVLRVRPLYLAGMLAFVAALPISLVNSFYPVYFQEIGFNETVTGSLNSLRPVGAIVIGMIFGRFFSKASKKILFTVGMCGTGLLILFTPLMEDAWILSPLMLFIGITAGVSQILYQTIVTEYSKPERRGISLALSGTAFSFSILIVPLLFGWLVKMHDLATAFTVIGSALVFVSMFTPLFFHYLIAKYKHVES